MRVFVCGRELGLGFVVARRLVAEGHQVNLLTGFEDLIPNLTKNGLNPVLGEITDDDPQRLLAIPDDYRIALVKNRRRMRVSPEVAVEIMAFALINPDGE